MHRIILLLPAILATILSGNPAILSLEESLKQLHGTYTCPTDTLQPPGTFDVYRYRPPELFTKTSLPGRIEFSMRNNDTSFCRISLYPAGRAGRDSLQELKKLWSAYVHKAFDRADSLPLSTMAGNKVDGWQSQLGLGNCYVNGRKCVMMLFTFRRDTLMAFSTALMSERVFKPPVESFYQSLHLLLPAGTAPAKKGSKH